jgi:hypothetical protein
MKTSNSLVVAAFLALPFCTAAPEAAGPGPDVDPRAQAQAGGDAQAREASARADKRYEEMLGKMQEAVEEVAQLYGNPVFLQVFTNDLGRADELKKRLRSARSGEEIQRELSELERRRDDLLNDIALKQREASRLNGRLIRQRAALDALAAAVEQARRAVEETAK